jgi:hypothetical protein
MQGFVVGADALSRRLIVVFNGEDEKDGRETALKPENLHVES